MTHANVRSFRQFAWHVGSTMATALVSLVAAYAGYLVPALVLIPWVAPPGPSITLEHLVPHLLVDVAVVGAGLALLLRFQKRLPRMPLIAGLAFLGGAMCGLLMHLLIASLLFFG